MLYASSTRTKVKEQLCTPRCKSNGAQDHTHLKATHGVHLAPDLAQNGLAKLVTWSVAADDDGVWQGKSTQSLTSCYEYLA